MMTVAEAQALFWGLIAELKLSGQVDPEACLRLGASALELIRACVVEVEEARQVRELLTSQMNRSTESLLTSMRHVDDLRSRLLFLQLERVSEN